MSHTSEKKCICNRFQKENQKLIFMDTYKFEIPGIILIVYCKYMFAKRV